MGCHHKVVNSANLLSAGEELLPVFLCSLSGGSFFFFRENDPFCLMAPAAMLVGRLAACGGCRGAGLFPRWATYSVSRQLARVNGLVRGKPPPMRPQSGSSPVAATVVRFGGKGWDFILSFGKLRYYFKCPLDIKLIIISFFPNYSCG